jgi:Ni/Fe-hydrogenase 1 B-type cytochrome subunit
MAGLRHDPDLIWRLIWAFLGNRYANWRAVLPGGTGYLRALEAYVAAFVAGRPQHYLGHNPPGRVAVLGIAVLLVVQAVTGLVLAGTDIFYPPFGGWIAHWIAAPHVDPSALTPLTRDLMDQSAYAAMRSFRAPFVKIHELAFYVIAAMVMLHVTAVIITELREGGSLISAMFSGRRILSRRPQTPSPITSWTGESPDRGMRIPSVPGSQ